MKMGLTPSLLLNNIKKQLVIWCASLGLRVNSFIFFLVFSISALGLWWCWLGYSADDNHLHPCELLQSNKLNFETIILWNQNPLGMQAGSVMLGGFQCCESNLPMLLWDNYSWSKYPPLHWKLTSQRWRHFVCGGVICNPQVRTMSLTAPLIIWDLFLSHLTFATPVAILLFLLQHYLVGF